MISISHFLSLLMFPVHYLINTWFLYLIFSPCWCFQSIISSIHDFYISFSLLADVSSPLSHRYMVSISHFLSLLMFPVHYLIDTWFLYLIFSPCWCFQSIISSIHGFYISFSLLADVSSPLSHRYMVSISHFLSLLMFLVHYLIDTWFLYLIFSPCWCFQSIISSIHDFYISFSLLADVSSPLSHRYMVSISHFLSLLMFLVHYLIDTWFLYLIFSPCWCFQSIISSIHDFYISFSLIVDVSSPLSHRYMVSISHFLSLLMFLVHYLIDTWFLYLIFSPCWCFQSIISSIHGFYISLSLLADVSSPLSHRYMVSISHFLSLLMFLVHYLIDTWFLYLIFSPCWCFQSIISSIHDFYISFSLLADVSSPLSH